MNLKKKEDNWIDYVVLVVQTAQRVGIDNIVIDDGKIRAIDDSKTVVMFQTTGVPELSIGSVGMNRVGTFMQRHSIITSQSNPKFSAVVDENKGYVRSIVMKSDDTKIEYRCANVDTIHAPKKINDEPVFQINIPRSSAALIASAQPAMSSELIEITADDEGVSFKVLDINNDGFTHHFADTANVIHEDGPEPKFSYKYDIKNILAVLSKTEDTMLEIGEKGIITASINGINILILPQM